MLNDIVFLVGPDRCGKTQIAQALASELGAGYYKASSEKNAFLNDQDRFLNDIRYSCPARLDLLKQLDASVVYDRGYPCEYAYSRFFGRPTDDAAVFWLDEQYAQLGATIIIASRRSFEGITDDLNPNIGKVQLEKLASLYDDFAKLTKCKVMKLWVDDEDLDREIRDILTFMDR